MKSKFLCLCFKFNCLMNAKMINIYNSMKTLVCASRTFIIYLLKYLKQIWEELLCHQNNRFSRDSDIISWESNRKGTAFQDDSIKGTFISRSKWESSYKMSNHRNLSLNFYSIYRIIEAYCIERVCCCSSCVRVIFI